MSTSYVVAKLDVWLRRDGRTWLAWCPRIDVMTQDSTQKGVLEALQEAVRLWFESCIDRNVLEEALKEVDLKRVPSDTPLNIAEKQESEFIMVATGKELSPPASLPKSNSLFVTIPPYIASKQLGQNFRETL